jgi:hypothetical protein
VYGKKIDIDPDLGIVGETLFQPEPTIIEVMHKGYILSGKYWPKIRERVASEL